MRRKSGPFRLQGSEKTRVSSTAAHPAITCQVEVEEIPAFEEYDDGYG
jgi:hypothetical protein